MRTTSNARLDAASTAARPSTDIVAHTTRPTMQPRPVSQVARRPPRTPLRIPRAMSGPGSSVIRITTPRNGSRCDGMSSSFHVRPGSWLGSTTRRHREEGCMAEMDWHKQSGSGPTSYAEFLVPAMFAPFAERLVEQAGIAPGSRVLDVACGTGVASRTAARRAGDGGSVTGVDLGEPTLEVACSWPHEDGAAAIDYVQSDATTLPLEDQIFDVVLCQQGLQFFPDRTAALVEMRRVLKPGGRLAIATWKEIEHTPFRAIEEALARHVSAEAAQMMRSPFVLHQAAE